MGRDQKKAKTRIVLASGSPRRRDLLESFFDLKIIVPKTSESRLAKETPRHYVQRVALKKWKKCASQIDRSKVVAADTTVFLGQRIFGKARSANEARGFLTSLSGKKHFVATAVVVGWSDQKPKMSLVITSVTFRKLSSSEIDLYISSQEWKGKAGAYAIQGLASSFVQSLSGSLTNVIGLPLSETLSLIDRLK